MNAPRLLVLSGTYQGDEGRARPYRGPLTVPALRAALTRARLAVVEWSEDGADAEGWS